MCVLGDSGVMYVGDRLPELNRDGDRLDRAECGDFGTAALGDDGLIAGEGIDIGGIVLRLTFSPLTTMSVVSLGLSDRRFLGLVTKPRMIGSSSVASTSIYVSLSLKKF